MLARSNRLRSARDIARVYKQGAFGSGGAWFTVKAAPSGRAQHRAVVVVAKKIDKRSVVRNRLRRRITEALRPLLATATPGYDIVITVRSNFDEVSPAELTADLTKALGRANVPLELTT